MSEKVDTGENLGLPGGRNLVVIQDVKARLRHALVNWNTLGDREMMWCLLQVTSSLEEVLQREGAKPNL